MRSVGQRIEGPDVAEMDMEIFGKFPAWYVKCKVWRTLKRNETLLLGVLVVRAHNLTHICMPTWKTLSDESGVAFSSIGKAMNRLEERGLIKRWRKGNRIRYHLEFEAPEWARDTANWIEGEDTSPKDSESYLRNSGTGRFSPRKTESFKPNVSEPHDSNSSESA